MIYDENLIQIEEVYMQRHLLYREVSCSNGDGFVKDSIHLV